LLLREGTTSGGSPIYGAAGYHLYYDPHCDTRPDTPGRWILSETEPSVHADYDLDFDGKCSPSIHVESNSSRLPPLTTQTWQVPCNPSDPTELSEQNVTLTWLPNGEKYVLLKGHSWYYPAGGYWWTQKSYWYVGNTNAIPRLNIPSLNMQDAAAGFRNTAPGMLGKATVWPSLLAMAATWNPNLLWHYGNHLGAEFRGKGGNGILGPSVNVHRIARNGRNFEYLSGEDPFLGSKLAYQYIQGIQNQGVFTVVKHWIFNQQETNRGLEDSEVDEKTMWELYLPPYQSAIDAGACAIMCSYNKVDGVYSCDNEKMFDILRNKMGFKGFMQSDWWASHNTSVDVGLDQEMPGIGSGEKGEPAFYRGDSLAEANQEDVDKAALRVLAVIERMQLTYDDAVCNVPDCKEAMLSDVRTDGHVEAAARFAAASVVMLKNKDETLPIRPPMRKIAIVGAAANAPSFDPNNQGQGYGDWATGDYYSGGGSGHMFGNEVTAYMGISRRAAQVGLAVTASLTDDVSSAVEAAEGADVIFVVAGTSSGESRDRENLELDGDIPAIIKGLREAEVEGKVVMLLMVPGAVVMPWRDQVDSIMVMFLGGEQTGTAWADVLFDGGEGPLGRLPITMPETEEDTIPPSEAEVVEYSEGLATGYRNTTAKFAYPFGFGLTYTHFELYPAFEEPHGQVVVMVTNTGTRRGSEVIQLYLEFPAEAGQPSPILKDFRRVTLEPGLSTMIDVGVSEQDARYYSAKEGGWKVASGWYTATIGKHFGSKMITSQFCYRDCWGSEHSHQHSKEHSRGHRGAHVHSEEKNSANSHSETETANGDVFYP